jgi:sugar O-acyltransferase (sialic acid O-acetyltransferase NeuD family)
MKELLIVGAGGYGREVLQWCKDINLVNQTWAIKGFLDDNADALSGYDCDFQVVGKIIDWQPSKNEVFVLAIADPNIKEKVVASLELRNVEFVSVIHPTASIGSFNKIGKGIVMYPDSRIVVNITIGDFVTILNNVSIGHDAIVGDYSTICGGCSINGNVNLGNKAFLGAHVTIIPDRKVGDGAFVGAGSVVMTDIIENTRVFGIPARRIATDK